MRKLLGLLFVALFISSCATPAPIPTATSAPTLAATPTPPYTQTPVPSTTRPPDYSTATPPDNPTTPTPFPPKVIIISIDGLRPDGLLNANAPNIFALAHRGSYTWDAQTVLPPATLPAHASMLSGYLPEAHGITWNDNLPERGTITVPTIFSIAHDAGLRTVMIVGKEKMRQLNAPGTVDTYIYITDGDRDAADRAVAQIGSGFDLMLVHLPNTDYFGHLTGWMSETYIAEIANTDSAVGRILDALPKNTTIILTADHGGHEDRHGSNILADTTIPWIIAGPNVLSDHVISSPVNVVDTAATAAYVLGLSLPPDAVGQPVYEAFGQSNPDLLHGQWQGGTAQTPARSEMPAAVLNGLIYVPGGFGGETVFQAYDPGGEAWIDLAPLPAGRHHSMTAVLDGKIYVLGGAAEESWDSLSTVFVYDPLANSWAVSEPMPEPRMSGSAVVFNGKIYIVGGVGRSSALLEYDPAAENWRSLAPLKQSREHFTAVVLDGNIYAIGGRWEGVGEFASVEIYDPASDTWRDGVPLLRTHSGFGAAVIRDRIVVAGGEIVIGGTETLTAMEVFDPRTGAWAFAPAVPIPLHGVAAASVNNRFYLLGGSSRAAAIENLGRVLVYVP